MTEVSQIILNCLKTDYQIDVATIHILQGGADTNASIYKVQGIDQTSYFVKVKHGPFNEVNFAILELLRTAGIREIIFPVKTMQGNLTQKMGDLTVIVYPFVEGQNGFVQPLTQLQWIQLGKLLRQIHSLKVPETIQRRMRREDFSPKWRELVRAFCLQIDDLLDQDEIGIKFKKFFIEQRTQIEKIVNSAEKLSQELRNQPMEYVLCHSDFHGGNVLFSKHGAFYIVDWDDPILAPKERDLMFIGGGVSNIWNQPGEEALFYEGYGNVFVDRKILAYYRFERIVEDMAVYSEGVLLNSKDREQMYQYFIAQFAPNGVVDIALKQL